MGYAEDLDEIERQLPAELERIRRIRKVLAPESARPDKLADYRDQRLNDPGGIRSIEPEFT